MVQSMFIFNLLPIKYKIYILLINTINSINRIYAGLNNLIQIFDISRPGEPINKKMTTPTRKSKHGQKGIKAKCK